MSIEQEPQLNLNYVSRGQYFSDRDERLAASEVDIAGRYIVRLIESAAAPDERFAIDHYLQVKECEKVTDSHFRITLSPVPGYGGEDRTYTLTLDGIVRKGLDEQEQGYFMMPHPDDIDYELEELSREMHEPVRRKEEKPVPNKLTLPIPPPDSL